MSLLTHGPLGARGQEGHCPLGATDQELRSRSRRKRQAEEAEIGKRTRRLKMLAAKAGLKDLTARHRVFSYRKPYHITIPYHI